MTGPTPLTLLTSAVDEMAGRIILRERNPVATSHTAIEVEGLDDPEVPIALGRYSAGALAGAVGLDAQLASAMLMTGVDARAELAAAVRRLIGDTNVFTTQSEIY